MAAPPKTKTRATYKDLEAVPESFVAEIVEGELYSSPRPAGPHAVAKSGLAAELINPFDRGRGGPGGWWILFEPELHLGDDVLVPDFAGWRRERLPIVPNVVGFTLAPDWVCEIVSPSTERLDRAKKLPVYAREGVRHVWLVNPLTRVLEILRNEDGRWVVVASHANDDLPRAEPFDAIELDLLALWGEERPARE